MTTAFIRQMPWFDRAGRLSILRLVVFGALLLPAAWLAVRATHGWLGSRPVTEAIHQSGLWSIRLIWLALAITPLRVVTRASQLIGVRRMIGVGAFCYAVLHFFLYVVDQHFHLLTVAAEIVLRVYLLIGFVAFCGLSALAATSTDAMIRRLGSQTWSRLHKVVFVAALLASVHFFMQSKADVSEPIVMMGILALLLACRVVQRWRRDLGPLATLALALTAAAATALGEAAWYGFKTGAPLDVVLEANLDFSFEVRPVWYVLAAGILLVSARLARRFRTPVRQPVQRRPAGEALPEHTTTSPLR